MAKSIEAFCPVCGAQVECKQIIEDGYKKVICNNCQYKISEKKIKKRPSSPEIPAPAPPTGKALEFVICADDTATIRESLADTLKASGIARTVVSVENGFEFLVTFQRNIDAGIPVDLVILDVNMPLLDGINAAIAMRAVEKETGVKRTPILFFTSNQADDNFIRALQYLAPARHLMKLGSFQGNEFAGQLASAIGDWRQETGAR